MKKVNNEKPTQRLIYAEIATVDSCGYCIDAPMVGAWTLVFFDMVVGNRRLTQLVATVTPSQDEHEKNGGGTPFGFGGGATWDGVEVYTATAVCHPVDEFVPAVGRKITMRRFLGNRNDARYKRGCCAYRAQMIRDVLWKCYRDFEQNLIDGGGGGDGTTD